MRSAIEELRGAGAEVVEVEIPDLQDHIVATSQYVARTKRDINEFLSTRSDLTFNQIVAEGRYHKDLDLIDAVMEGPDDPEDDPDYFRRISAREDFTRASVNVMARNRLDAAHLPHRADPGPDDGRPQGLDDADLPDEHAHRLTDMVARHAGARGLHRQRTASRTRIRRRAIR